VGVRAGAAHTPTMETSEIRGKGLFEGKGQSVVYLTQSIRAMGITGGSPSRLGGRG